MTFARLQKVQRYLARYPQASTRESAKDREFQRYLESLSIEELNALYNERMAELDNDPEMIANNERWSKMTYEELLNEYFEKLKAS
jgi:hypothetical protein